MSEINIEIFEYAGKAFFVMLLGQYLLGLLAILQITYKSKKESERLKKHTIN